MPLRAGVGHDASGPPLTVNPDRHKLNDHRLRVFGRDGDSPIGFVCECDDAGCARTVVLTGLAYEDLRREGKPLLFPGHLQDADAPLAAETPARTDGAVSPG